MIDTLLDEWLMNTVFNKNGGITSYYCSNYFFEKRPDIKQYLELRYDDIPKSLFSYKEVIYRIKNNVNKRYICPICGKPVPFINLLKGYQAACSRSCTLKLESVRNKIKNTSLEKYGVSHYNKSELSKERHKYTCLEKYGYEYIFQVPEIKNKIYTTFNNHYNNKLYLNSEQYKKDMSEKYNIPYEEFTNVMNIDIVKEKLHNSLKRSGLFNYSKDEEYIYTELLKVFKKDNIFRQYKSSLYPFKSDFYIKSINFYIEYLGTWLHGYHPFNPTNNTDLKILLLWKSKSDDSIYYKYAIYIWTKSDPLKRNIAKINNLNYIEFFNIEEFKNWLNQYTNYGK